MAESNGTEVAAKEYIKDPILDTEEMKKLFVGGIAKEATDEEFKALFEEVSGGTVTDHVIVRKEKETRNHFGFVTFESSALIDSVLLKRKELLFHGKTLDVHRAVPKNNTSPGAHDKTKKLFIANLPKTGCSEEDLKKYFEERHDPAFGTIESVQLIKKKDAEGNKTEENKGFGFVTVSSEDLADKMAIQHSTFELGGRKIELKKSSPPGGEGQRGRGGRGGRGGHGAPRGGHGQYGVPAYGGYGGYGGYPGQWDYGYDYYGGYGGYPGAYGGGYGGAAPGQRGKRYAPY